MTLKEPCYCPKSKFTIALYWVYGILMIPICLAIAVVVYPLLVPFGFLFVYPWLVLYKKRKKLSWYELDTVVWQNAPKWLRPIIATWTNETEPMPMRKGAQYLWRDKPDWIRYILWHFRNPISDFGRYYLGYYKYRHDLYYLYEYDKYWIRYRVKRVPQIKFLFMRWDFYVKGYWLCIGWKHRGVFSISFKYRPSKRPY